MTALPATLTLPASLGAPCLPPLLAALGLFSTLSSSMQHSLVCSSVPSGFFSSFSYSSPFTRTFFADIPQMCVSTLTSFLSSGLNFRWAPNQTLYPPIQRQLLAPVFLLHRCQRPTLVCLLQLPFHRPSSTGSGSVILPSGLTAARLVLLVIRVLSPQSCALPSKKTWMVINRAI